MLHNPASSPLGKQSSYNTPYDPDKLFPMPRSAQRITLGIDPANPPFYGFDCWNHYEVSWLNEKGKPIVALAHILYDCNSPNIVESKSLKLYFNSLNSTVFKDVATLTATVQHDLATRIGAAVSVNITPLDQVADDKVHRAFAGHCLDAQDIDCAEYQVNPALLFTEDNNVEETLYSDLLKSNCLVTNQPDWGSVQISYKGKQINHAGLLKYIVSFREHNEFHEHCIERIFVDIMQQCHPLELTVYGRYTRRGGLDINPYRSTKNVSFEGKNLRFCRQ